MSTFLHDLPRRRALEPQHGIYSVCSAHPFVLEAAMRRQRQAAGPLLFEATCNQVNQFGGYTGMRAGDFRELVHTIATRTEFPADRILLGGDHLGPHPWRHLTAARAMANACEMVRHFVGEGYRKIHLDASMSCSDDPSPLTDNVIADRAAALCAAAEDASPADEIVYVIGTEVPTPGGALSARKASVTTPEAAEAALRVHRQAFQASRLDRAWQRVIALVVQPGVEFSDVTVENYEADKAAQLSAWLGQNSGIVFEAHSTDYQRPQALAALVRDGFAILKVGPALTYAMRQALFALEAIEAECVGSSERSHLRERIDEVMLKHPEHWREHYRGTQAQQQRLRIHSYSDRIRYYWMYPEAKEAVEALISNLERSRIPETILSDYLPAQYWKVRAGALQNEPLPLILDAIGDALDPYIAACRNTKRAG